ncbi:MAG: bifunctional DNA primase/polymerase [Acidimicrobiales bacterium]
MPATLNALDEALWAAEQGVATVATCWPGEDGTCPVHGERCFKPGKRPLRSKRDATCDTSEIRARHNRYPLAGLKWILNDQLVVIDVDAANSGLETTTRWYIEYGPIAATPVDWNGHDRGGHYVMRLPRLFEGVVALGPGVEAFGPGSEIVMPPSAYYLGGHRSWRLGLSPRDVEIAEAPAWLVKKIRAGAMRGSGPPRRRKGGPLTAAELAEFARAFSSIGLSGSGRAQGRYFCPFHGSASRSLSIDWERGLFNCFVPRCDAHGSLGSLRRLVEGSAA